MFNFFEKKAGKRLFNFREAYQFLKQEQKSALFKALAAYQSASEQKSKDEAWFALNDVAREVLSEEKLPTDKETVLEFVGGLLQIPNQDQYMPATAEPVAGEAVTSPEALPTNTLEFQGIESQPRVSPTRVVRPDQFEGLEPVAVAPRTPAEKGEDALKALLAEAQAEQHIIDAKYGATPVKLEHSPVDEKSPHIVDPRFKPEDLAWKGPQGRDSQVSPKPPSTM